MEILFKWKYILFTLLFYVFLIKQCSFNDRYSPENDSHSQNTTTTTTVLNTQKCNNYRHVANALLSPACYLTIIPVYNLANIKYFFHNNKTNFFHRYISFKSTELNDLIDDLHYELNELKLIRMNSMNLTGYRLPLDYNHANDHAKSRDCKSNDDGFYYESVYFNNVNKTIIRSLLHDKNNMLLSSSTLTHPTSPSSFLKNTLRMHNHNYCNHHFNIDANYWDEYYLQAFNSSINSLFVDEASKKMFRLAQNSDNASAKNGKRKKFIEKLTFNYESEHVLSLNLNLNTNYNYTLLNYAIIYDKQEGNLYLNLQTDSFKNLRFKLSDYKRDVWHKTSDKVPFKSKLKSVKFDVVKYGTLANFSLSRCNSSENSSMMSYIHEYDCEIKQENYLLEHMKIREHNQDIINLFVSYLKQIEGFTEIEASRCIIKEYFGKIFTCDGRQITPSEYAILKRRGIKFLGVAVKVDNKRVLFESDKSGFIIENKDKVVLKDQKNSNSGSQVTCHECTKFDLRAKIEANEAYNQYKQAIKTHKNNYEQFMILTIVLSSVFFVYLRSKKSRK